RSTVSPAFRIGTVCILSESGEGNSPDDGYRWSELEFTPSSRVIIDAGDPADNSVTAINTLTPVGAPMASFSVLKRVEGPDGSADGFQNPNRAFTVDYSCTIDGVPSMGYAPDRQTVVNPTGTGRLDLRAFGPAAEAPWFVTGTICNLSEDNPAYGNDFIDAGHEWDQAVFTPSSTVRLEGPDAVAAVTLTNTFSVTEIEPAPLRERFALTKTVDGPAGEIVNPDRLFRIGYACTFEGAPATGYDADGQIVSDGTGILTPKAGQTIRGPFFQIGTTCTFTEEQTGGGEDFPGHEGEFRWSEVTFNQPMPITIRHQEDHPVEIVANNRYEAVTTFGSFTLTKRIEGPDPEALADDLSFAVDFACTRDGLPAIGYDPDDPTTIVAPTGTGTLTLPGDGGVVPGPRFRTGTTCELREDPGNRDDDFTLPGYQWSDAVFTPGSTFTLDRDASEPISIVLTNHFTDTEAPSGPETPPDATLPVTGSDGPILILLATALVAGGITLLSRRRGTSPFGPGRRQ
ncbi:MAG: hypothetical protein KIT69_03840, partial [Propionibacteriaceae bacterium]|nr:hypothetical protein [Propionibacteriaceae bacterium]